MWVIFIHTHFHKCFRKILICLLQISFINLRDHIHYNIHLWHLRDKGFEFWKRIDSNLYHLLHLRINLSFIANKDNMWNAKNIKDYSMIKTRIFLLCRLNTFSIENKDLFEPSELIFLLFNVNEATIHSFGATSSWRLKLSSKQGI